MMDRRMDVYWLGNILHGYLRYHLKSLFTIWCFLICCQTFNVEVGIEPDSTVSGNKVILSCRFPMDIDLNYIQWTQNGKQMYAHKVGDTGATGPKPDYEDKISDVELLKDQGLHTFTLEVNNCDEAWYECLVYDANVNEGKQQKKLDVQEAVQVEIFDGNGNILHTCNLDSNPCKTSEIPDEWVNTTVELKCSTSGMTAEPQLLLNSDSSSNKVNLNEDTCLYTAYNTTSVYVKTGDSVSFDCKVSWRDESRTCCVNFKELGPESGKLSGAEIGGIVAGVVVALLVVFVVGLAIFILLRIRQKKSHSAETPKAEESKMTKASDEKETDQPKDTIEFKNMNSSGTANTAEPLLKT